MVEPQPSKLAMPVRSRSPAPISVESTERQGVLPPRVGRIISTWHDHAMTESQTAGQIAQRFTDQVVVVTGGASGIGRASAERFLQEGAMVVVGDLDQLGLDQFAALHGDRVAVLRTDVTVETDLEALCALAIKRYGHLDIAIANAGRGHYSPIVDHQVEDFRAILDLCVTGVFLTIKHAGRVMSNGGSIVTIASLNGVQPSAGMSAYCAAKAAVMMLTQVSAMELGPRGIRVNSVAPGLVETAATAPMLSFPKIREEFIENTTLGRSASPEEIAGLIAFLASHEAGFISGSTHLIDGGASTGRYPNLPKVFGNL
jgi:NAD(P)-dependent dehydrogenase (short-subunit alcohol dehydrogenase family)